MANQDRQFDVRTLKRNLERGTISREAYDAYLASLPDASENAAPIEAEFVEGVLEPESEAGEGGTEEQ